ncbi:hypothetical protein DFH29DRAFT_997246 [Suillus ampliporus]|nr:hypothetical protein DFH29DRAFT_997246 [Suillus ampliporus]
MPPPEVPRPDLDPQPAPYRTCTPESARPHLCSPLPHLNHSHDSGQPCSHKSPPDQRLIPLHSTPSPAPSASPSPARPSTSPRSPPQPSASSTPQPPPPLSALLAMSPSSLSRLPIHTLKLILYEARVRLPTDILEKGEFVARVSTWLEEERTATEERDRIEREEREQEEWERQEREERERREAQRSTMETEPEYAHTHGSGHPTYESQQHSSPSSSSPPPQSHSPPKTTEHSGLCVICQDQEANIAITFIHVPRLLRASSRLISRVPALSHSHRHRSTTFTDIQDIGISSIKNFFYGGYDMDDPAIRVLS